MKKRPGRPPAPRTRRPVPTAVPFAAPAEPERYHFQLYITGTSPRSVEAVANIRALCEEYLAGRYELEVIDMYQQPDRATMGQIIASPTLVKRLPTPLMRMVGNLANRDQLLVKLNLAAHGVGHFSPVSP